MKATRRRGDGKVGGLAVLLGGLVAALICLIGLSAGSAGARSASFSYKVALGPSPNKAANGRLTFMNTSSEGFIYQGGGQFPAGTTFSYLKTTFSGNAGGSCDHTGSAIGCGLTVAPGGDVYVDFRAIPPLGPGSTVTTFVQFSNRTTQTQKATWLAPPCPQTPGCAPVPTTRKCVSGHVDLLSPEPDEVRSGDPFYLVNTCTSLPFPRKAPPSWKTDFLKGNLTIPAAFEVEAPWVLRLNAPKVPVGKARLTAAELSPRARSAGISIFGFKFRFGGRKAKAKRPLKVLGPAPKPNPNPPPPSPSGQKCVPQYGLPQIYPRGVSFRAGDIVHFLLYCGTRPGTGYRGVLTPRRITFYVSYGFGNLTWDISTGVFVNRTKYPDPFSVSCPPPGPCWRVISDTDLEVRLPTSLNPTRWIAVVTRRDGKQFPAAEFVIR